MRSLCLCAVLGLSTLVNSYACDDIKTTQAIVEYVCHYSLVSDTQCRIWKEDVRQMNQNNEIIIDSFISWDKKMEMEQHTVAEAISGH